MIKVELPQAALSNTDENVSVILEEPHGSPSKLGPDRNCFVTIRHDRGEYYTCTLYTFIKIFKS